MQQHIWRIIKWLSLGIAIASIILTIVLMQISGPEQATTTNSSREDDPGTQVESPVIVERKDGSVVWTLRAQEANQQLDGQMRFSQPTLVLYTNNEQEITIVSQQAWFDPLARNLRFEDQVLVRYGDWSVSTDVMFYLSASDEIHMPNAFKLWGRNIKARGKNMRLHRQTEQVHVDDGIWIEDSKPSWQGVTP